jgi:ATP-dependent DNA ligase
VIATDNVLDFDALLLRIHPAASRVEMLSKEKPASFVAWDILALGDEDLRAVPQVERRGAPTACDRCQDRRSPSPTRRAVRP